MAWFCPTELDLVNPIMAPYPCCVQGPAPINHLVFGTQQACHDNTSCCNNANQPGTGNLDVCCGGIDQGDPCTYTAWLSLTQAQRDGICQYCATLAAGTPCESSASLSTTTTTTEVVNRGVKRCPQFGPQIEFMAQPWNLPLYSVVWSYPLGTILHLQVSFFNFFDGSYTHYIACWEVVEFSATYVCAEANGTLLTPTPVLCDPCPVPPGPSCTTTTTSEPPPPPAWCIKKCCDDSVHKIDATFPWDWTGVLALMPPGTAWLAQSFNNLNGTGLQECYYLPDPAIFGCYDYPLLALAPPIITYPLSLGMHNCDFCLNQNEYGQIGDVYQWFPPTLPPPTGQAVDTGVDANLCDPTRATTTTTTEPTPSTTTTTTCIPGCIDPTACNFNPLAQCDDGSCIGVVYGCTDNGGCIGTACPNAGTCTNPTGWATSPWLGCPALNYYPGAQMDDFSCFGYCNCLEPNATNYNFTGEIGVVPTPAPSYLNGVYIDCAGGYQMTGINWNGNVGDTSCCGPIVTTTTTVCIWGCTDPSQLNYDPLATCDDGSCIPIIYGCMDDGCCTTGISPDPLVGDPCAGGATGLYHLCPQGGLNQPSYNSPNPPPGAMNFYFAANVDDSQCVYLPLAVTFFELGANPASAPWGQSCASTYQINIGWTPAGNLPEGQIKFTFEAHTTNPGVYYDANPFFQPTEYTHNTVTTSLSFNGEVFTTCPNPPMWLTGTNWSAGLPSCLAAEGQVPVKVIITLTSNQGTVYTGEAALQDFATSVNISAGYNNNSDMTGNQTCDQAISTPGGFGGCV